MADTQVGTAVGVGASSLEDPRAAATKAVTDALAGRAPQTGDIVFVFATVCYDAQALVSAAQAAAEPAVVVACSAYGAFTTTGPPQRCSATYVPAARLTIGVGGAIAVDGDLHRAARDAAELARDHADVTAPHGALVILSDGLAGDQREVVRGAYEIAGATVPIVGGAAGEDLSISRTWQAIGDQLHHNAVLAVWLSSPEPLGVAVEHGWQPVSRPLLVTRAEDNVIMELDGRPAAELYLELRGELQEGEDTFAGQVLDHPFGLPTQDGGYEIRHIMADTPDGLQMFGYVHDQAILRIMAADQASLVNGARSAVRSAVAQLTTPPRGALLFSCTARTVMMGPDIDAELKAIAAELGGACGGGLFTYGEFARRTGATGFHNASLAVLAL